MENSYIVRINIFGKMNETDFLERLYNLEELESCDSGFPNMKGYISTQIQQL